MGFAAIGLFTGCALEEVDPGPGGDGEYVRIPSDDPVVDARLDALGIICESTLRVTGTFTEGAAQPADLNGCWPVGTWTFTVSVDRQGCDPQDELTTEYVYEITRDEETDSNNVVYVDDPDNDRQNLKITTNSDNLCHGSFEHFGLDDKVLIFKPTLEAGNILDGAGTFSVWEEDPF